MLGSSAAVGALAAWDERGERLMTLELEELAGVELEYPSNGHMELLIHEQGGDLSRSSVSLDSCDLAYGAKVTLSICLRGELEESESVKPSNLWLHVCHFLTTWIDELRERLRLEQSEMELDHMGAVSLGVIMDGSGEHPSHPSRDLGFEMRSARLSPSRRRRADVFGKAGRISSLSEVIAAIGRDPSAGGLVTVTRLREFAVRTAAKHAVYLQSKELDILMELLSVPAPVSAISPSRSRVAPTMADDPPSDATLDDSSGISAAPVQFVNMGQLWKMINDPSVRRDADVGSIVAKFTDLLQQEFYVPNSSTLDAHAKELIPQLESISLLVDLIESTSIDDSSVLSEVYNLIARLRECIRVLSQSLNRCMDAKNDEVVAMYRESRAGHAAQSSSIASMGSVVETSDDDRVSTPPPMRLPGGIADGGGSGVAIGATGAPSEAGSAATVPVGSTMTPKTRRVVRKKVTRRKRKGRSMSMGGPRDDLRRTTSVPLDSSTLGAGVHTTQPSDVSVSSMASAVSIPEDAEDDDLHNGFPDTGTPNFGTSVSTIGAGEYEIDAPPKPGAATPSGTKLRKKKRPQRRSKRSESVIAPPKYRRPSKVKATDSPTAGMDSPTTSLRRGSSSGRSSGLIGSGGISTPVKDAEVEHMQEQVLSLRRQSKSLRNEKERFKHEMNLWRDKFESLREDMDRREKTVGLGEEALAAQLAKVKKENRELRASRKDILSDKQRLQIIETKLRDKIFLFIKKLKRVDVALPLRMVDFGAKQRVEDKLDEFLFNIEWLADRYAEVSQRLNEYESEGDLRAAEERQKWIEHIRQIGEWSSRDLGVKKWGVIPVDDVESQIDVLSAAVSAIRKKQAQRSASAKMRATAMSESIVAFAEKVLRLDLDKKVKRGLKDDATDEEFEQGCDLLYQSIRDRFKVYRDQNERMLGQMRGLVDKVGESSEAAKSGDYQPSSAGNTPFALGTPDDSVDPKHVVTFEDPSQSDRGSKSVDLDSPLTAPALHSPSPALPPTSETSESVTTPGLSPMAVGRSRSTSRRRGRHRKTESEVSPASRTPSSTRDRSKSKSRPTSTKGEGRPGSSVFSYTGSARTPVKKDDRPGSSVFDWSKRSKSAAASPNVSKPSSPSSVASVSPHGPQRPPKVRVSPMGSSSAAHSRSPSGPVARGRSRTLASSDERPGSSVFRRGRTGSRSSLKKSRSGRGSMTVKSTSKSRSRSRILDEEKEIDIEESSPPPPARKLKSVTHIKSLAGVMSPDGIEDSGPSFESCMDQLWKVFDGTNMANSEMQRELNSLRKDNEDYRELMDAYTKDPMGREPFESVPEFWSELDKQTRQILDENEDFKNELQRLKDMLDAMKQDVEELKQSKEQLENEKGEIQGKLDESVNRCEDLQKRLDELQAKLDDKESDLSQNSTKMDEVKAMLEEANAQRERLEKELSDKQAEIDECVPQLQESREQCEKLTLDLESVNKELSQIRGLLEDKKDESHKLEMELTEQRSVNEQLQADLEQSKAISEDWRECARSLHRSMFGDDSKDEDPSTGDDTSEKKDSEDLMLSDSRKWLSSVQDKLESERKEKNDWRDCASQLHRSVFGQEMAAESGPLDSSSSKMTDTSGFSDGRQWLSSVSDELDRQNKEKEEWRECCQQLHRQVFGDSKKMPGDEGADGEESLKDMDFTDGRTWLQSVSDELDRQRQETAQKMAEFEQLQKEHEELQNEKEQLQNDLAETSTVRDQLESELAESKTNNDGWKDVCSKVHEKVFGEEATHTEEDGTVKDKLEDRQLWLESVADKLDEERQKYQERLDALMAQMEEEQREKDERQNELDQLKQELETQKQEAENVRSELEETQAERERLQNQLEQTQASLDQWKDACSKLGKTIMEESHSASGVDGKDSAPDAAGVGTDSITSEKDKTSALSSESSAMSQDKVADASGADTGAEATSDDAKESTADGGDPLKSDSQSEGLLPDDSQEWLESCQSKLAEERAARQRQLEESQATVDEWQAACKELNATVFSDERIAMSEVDGSGDTVDSASSYAEMSDSKSWLQNVTDKLEKERNQRQKEIEAFAAEYGFTQRSQKTDEDGGMDESLSAEYASVSGFSTDAEDRWAPLREGIESLQKEKSELETRLAETNEKCNNLEEMLSNHDSKSSELSNKMDELVAAHDLSLQTLKDEMAAKKKHCDEKKAELQSVIDELTEKNGNLTKEHEGSAKEIADLKESLADAISKIPPKKEYRSIGTQTESDYETMVYERFRNEFDNLTKAVRDENLELLCEVNSLAAQKAKFGESFANHELDATCMAVCPIHMIAVTAGKDRTVRLWRPLMSDASLAGGVPTPKGAASAAGLGGSGGVLSPRASKKSTAIKWGAFKYAKVDGTVFSLCWSKNGDLIGAGCSLHDTPNGYVVVWNASSSEVVCSLRSRPTQRFGRVHSVAFACKDQVICGGDTTGSVLLWDILTLHVISVLSPSRDIIHGITVAEGFLYSASHDQRIMQTSIKKIDGRLQKMWKCLGGKTKLEKMPELAVQRIVQENERHKSLQMYKNKSSLVFMDEKYPLYVLTHLDFTPVQLLVTGSRKMHVLDRTVGGQPEPIPVRSKDLDMIDRLDSNDGLLAVHRTKLKHVRVFEFTGAPRLAWVDKGTFSAPKGTSVIVGTGISADLMTVVICSVGPEHCHVTGMRIPGRHAPKDSSSSVLSAIDVSAVVDE